MLTTLALLIHTAYAAPQPLYDLTFSAKAARFDINAVHLMVRPGSPAKLVQSDANGRIEVEVSAAPTREGQIFVTADMYHVDARGHRRHLGQPQLLAKNNEAASMDVGAKDPRSGRDVIRYSMQVLAKVKK